MSTERDLGLQALQNGDINTAIEQLERACQLTPEDYQAHLYLGAAYGDAKRYMDAINILTTAVQMQPSNPQARYNLGIAMERGGYPEQAVTAMEQALTLQPDYPKAAEALQRLRQPQVPVAPLSPAAEGLKLSAHPSSYAQPMYGQPLTGDMPSQAPVNAPSAYGAPAASPPASSYAASSNSSLPYAAAPATYGSPPPAQYNATPVVPSSYAPPSPYGAPPPMQGPQTTYSPLPAAPVQPGSTAGAAFLGFVLGGVGGVIGLILWITIAIVTHIQIGYAAIGVGILIGWMTKLGLRQPSKTGGIIAAIISFFSLGLGCLITSGIGDPLSIVFTLLFIVIGVSASYRFAAN